MGARGVFGVLALLFLGVLAGCDAAPAVPERQGNPPAWHIVDAQGREGWLLGSIHLLPENVRWITPALKDAEGRAGLLIVEAADANDAAAAHSFARLGAAPQALPLTERLPAASRARAETVIASSGADAAMLARMDSWAAALSLASAQSAGAGLSPERGVESVLSRRFRDAGKPIAGLETAERQFALFDTLPEADQRVLLAAVIDGAPTARADYDRNLTAWLNRDLTTLASAAGDGVLGTERLREALLHGRNRAWAEAITRHVADGRRPLVVVGAGHVSGPDGLPALLAARGFRVTALR